MTGDGSALHLVLTAGPGLFAIVRLSLVVSVGAVALGALIGLPFGAFLRSPVFRAARARLFSSTR